MSEPAGNSLIETFFNHQTKRFFTPSRWFWGAGAAEHAMGVVSGLEAPLLVIDSHLMAHPVAEALRLAARVDRVHEVHGFPATQDAIALAPQLDDVDGLVVVGGGSAIDLAKGALAHHLFGDLDGVGMGPRRGESPRPEKRRPLLVSLPTTCGSGAEASRYYVTYDRHSRAKVHGKSWHLVSDWIFTDPAFLAQAPAALVVETAFDAFVHFWESYFCRYEASWMSRALSLHGMETILSALPAALAGPAGEQRGEALSRLGYAATLGGIAISNVRTGNIHEAAGALLEATALSHGQTLYVFFAEAAAQYRDTIAGSGELCALLGKVCAHPRPDPLPGLIEWWDRIFSAAGHADTIAGALRDIDRPALISRIFSRVHSDRVWCEKESPIRLDDRMIQSLIGNSLSRFAP